MSGPNVGALTSCTDFCSAKDDDKYNSNSVYFIGYLLTRRL
jgi:hypothetical protein